MLQTARIILSGTPLIALPSLAAERELQIGITSVGPAKFLFTLAAALLLTLIFRSMANRLSKYVGTKMGQWRVRAALAKCGPDILHDFILPGAYGGLAKIDHAILISGGIICIQTKHHRGLLFGEKSDAQWSSLEGSKRQRFLNPLIQNEGRSRALNKVVPGVPVANLVVFSADVEFTAPPPANVINVSQLQRYVATFKFSTGMTDKLDTAWPAVKAAAMTDTDTRKDLSAQLGFS